jgi:hypothetical protein
MNCVICPRCFFVMYDDRAWYIEKEKKPCIVFKNKNTHKNKKIKAIEIQKKVNYLITLAETKKTTGYASKEKKVEISFYTITKINSEIQCTVEQWKFVIAE